MPPEPTSPIATAPATGSASGSAAAASAAAAAPAAPEPVRRIRVLISKCGLDGHDRGARVVARALRDHGFEVVYLGIHQTPETVVAAALAEDVDCIGVSIHSAAHMTVLPRILELLRQRGAEDVLVVGGGIIPKAHVAELKRLGIGEVFGPGAPIAEFAGFIRHEVVRRRSWKFGEEGAR